VTDTEQLEARGRELALATLGAVRTLETHGPDNQAFSAALERLRGLIERDLAELGQAVRLDIIDQRLLLNGARLRAFGTTQEQLDQLASVFAERKLGGVVFAAPLEVETLRRWLARFIHKPRDAAEAASLRQELEAVAPGALSVLDMRTLTTPEHEATVRVSTMAFAMQTYARTVLAHRDFVAASMAGRDPYANRLNVVRVVQDLIDVVAARADLLFMILNLAITRELGHPYAATHAANTCAYSLMIGHVLQLDRTALLDLGTSALLADASTLAHSSGQRPSIPHEAEVPWTDEERARHRAELTRSVRGTLELGALDDALTIRAIVAFERDQAAREGPHPYSRIAAVADAYDALTQRRAWRDGYGPQQALRLLLREPAGRFDPQVLLALECVLTAYLGVTA
jgi:HD-GYP domain-containing protein (c-di-GMP phosphodiesterase class II)